MGTCWNEKTFGYYILYHRTSKFVCVSRTHVFNEGNTILHYIQMLLQIEICTKSVVSYQ